MIKKIELSGTVLEYQDIGQGSPILLLHGGGGPEIYSSLLQTLGETHRVFVPMLPGFDGNPEPVWMERPADVAYFYLDFIRALELEKPTLIGHSLGGWIAAEIAIRQDNLLERLCLVSSAGIHVKGIKRGDNFLWSPEQTVRNFFVDEGLIQDALSRLENIDDPMLAIQRQRIVAKLAWKPRWHEPQLQRWLKRINIPTQIIWGEEDRLFPKEYGQTFAELIGESKLKVIKQCGHLPFIEREEIFVSVLTEFLGEV